MRTYTKCLCLVAERLPTVDQLMSPILKCPAECTSPQVRYTDTTFPFPSLYPSEPATSTVNKFLLSPNSADHAVGSRMYQLW